MYELDKKPNSLLYTLKSLEKKKIIQGFRPRIDFQKLGFSYYVVSFAMKNVDERTHKLILKTIKSLGGVIYITEAIGSFDIEFELLTKNQLELIEKLDILESKFPNNLSSMSYHLTTSLNAFNNWPL